MKMEITMYSDEYFMKEALKEAQKALKMDEIPVGAVMVNNNRIIARAHNFTEHLTDFTAHAEMQVYTSASGYLGNKYLDECTLYVTLEPCVMCAGAAFWTRVGRIVYGAGDEKRGYLKVSSAIPHPKTAITTGVLEHECSTILTNFFRSKR